MRSVVCSTLYSRVILGAGPCFIAAFSAIPACADDAATLVPANRQLGMLALNFDLAGQDGDVRVTPSQAHEAAGEATEEGALDEPQLPRQPWADDGFKREWSIQPVNDGPALEVAALGGGQKKSGKLAHVRVSWAF